MSLSAGDKLGPYEIIAKIGAGGMGEVYRAHDPRLRRDVAIKVSAERFSERFEREAHAVAALNHPNICAIYDVGPNYIVMEYIEGEAPKGPLPLDEVLRIARQIGDALEEAHGKGIVHRDLKPANIKIKPDGVVKVLDFGLAKVGPTSTSAGLEAGPTQSPTLSMATTQAGMILGTAGYMSPEQARGKPVDKRADIWAFGVVVHELLTGRRVFAGEDVTSTLAKVIEAEPSWSGVSPKVQRLLKSCLEKDPKNRLRDIADAWRLLEDAPASAPSQSRLGNAGWIAAAVAIVIAGVALWAPWRVATPAPDVKRFQVSMQRNADGRPFAEFAVSPDGRYIAYVASGEGERRLWIHSLDTLEAHSVPGTTVGQIRAPTYPFWSPDSRYVAFFGEGKLKKVDVLASSPPQTLCDVRGLTILAGTWSRNGAILFTDGPVMRVAEAGGTPSPALSGLPAGEVAGYPYFLPDGNRFLYYRSQGETPTGSVYIGTLDQPSAQKGKLLLAAEGAAVFAPGPSGVGYLLFRRESTLFAQRFDPNSLQLEGEALPVTNPVGSFADVPSYSASANGVLVHHPGTSTGKAQLTWLDRQGKAIGTVGEPFTFNGLRVSPDGTRAAMSIWDDRANQSGIWVQDLAQGLPLRLTFGKGSFSSPVWSPDGNQIAFAKFGAGREANLYRKAANGLGGEVPLLQEGHSRQIFGWSSNGHLLYCESGKNGSCDLWALPLEGEPKPFVVLATDADEREAAFSPDGKFFAYVSDENGTSELDVRTFPNPAAGRWNVGGTRAGSPRWRQDGKELFYIDFGGPSMMSVDVTLSPVFRMGTPKVLFKLPAGASGIDVTPDGKRFLTGIHVAADSQPPFTVVLNWQAGLK